MIFCPQACYRLSNHNSSDSSNGRKTYQQPIINPLNHTMNNKLEWTILHLGCLNGARTMPKRFSHRKIILVSEYKGDQTCNILRCNICGIYCSLICCCNFHPLPSITDTSNHSQHNSNFVTRCSPLAGSNFIVIRDSSISEASPTYSTSFGTVSGDVLKDWSAHHPQVSAYLSKLWLYKVTFQIWVWSVVHSMYVR